MTLFVCLYEVLDTADSCLYLYGTGYSLQLSVSKKVMDTAYNCLYL